MNIIDPLADPEAYMEYMLGRDTTDISYIIDGIYISNWQTATNEDLLVEKKINNVMCIAQFNKSKKELAMYDERKINHYHFKLMDENNVNISDIFAKTNKIIASCVNSKVPILVHCQEGMSRSVTIVMAYLIYKYNLTNVAGVLKAIQTKREVANPNYGFRKQLAIYAKEINKLKK